MLNNSFTNALEKAAGIMGADKEGTVVAYKEACENSVKKRETNAATDIISTGNTGYGAEAMVDVSYSDELYSMIAQMPGLMSKLPANHGQKQGDTVTVDVIGEVALFDTATEPTGAQTYVANATSNAMATGKVDITLKSFRTIIAVTKKGMHDAIGGASLFYNRIQNRILLGLERTLEAYIINADSTTTETPVADANVNFFDVDGTVTIPAAAYYLGGNSGIRKEAIANTIVGGNVAFTRGQLLATMAKVSDYLDDYNTMLWILSGAAQVKARGLAEYSTQDKFGADATNSQGGKITFIEGIQTYTAKHMPAAVGVSGKVEVGTVGVANNYQTLSLIHTYAPQYAFGHDMEFVVSEDSQRIFFDVSARFGAAIVDEKAGLGKTVAQLVYQA